MNILICEPLAKRVRFDINNMWIELSDGRQLGIPLVYFPRLLNATEIQRKQYIISGGGSGLHWDDLDEDISVKSLLLGIGDQTNYNNAYVQRKAS
ncbi:MAG: DUF2442 domain-containing protein [Desulfobacterales bacterium]|nr:DUF2442 domain-containing protein [Desulfobacterales bacterium]